ncbi:MAG: 30S ribosomal protein S6 [bacterium]|nr:30S ribosomal protein S6 [bacterium]
MKGYETLVILKADLSETENKALIEKIKGWITKNGGSITLENALGVREIATPIKHIRKGYYYQLQFESAPKVIEEFNENVRITETILRHLVVELDSIQEKETEAAA